jgi:hypothetical protein
MKNQKLDKKVLKDVGKVKKDLSTLAGDSAARFGRFESDVSLASDKARKDLSKQVKVSATQLGKRFDKATGNAAKAVAGASAKMKKDAGNWWSHFNTKAQEVAVEVPKELDKKASGFPWAVVITIGLVLGFVLGLLLQPARMSGEPV